MIPIVEPPTPHSGQRLQKFITSTFPTFFHIADLELILEWFYSLRRLLAVKSSKAILKSEVSPWKITSKGYPDGFEVAFNSTVNP